MPETSGTSLERFSTLEEKPIEAALRQELRQMLDGRVCFDEPLSRHTSLRVGGPADVLARPASREELGALLAFCSDRALPFYLLGGGFNSLAPDIGVRGVVVRLQGLQRITQEPEGLVFAEAGATHTRVTRFCAEHGRAGLEFAVGIPGSVGGWIAMNAGTAEREMKDVVARVEQIEAASGELHTVARADLRFHYRSLELDPSSVIVSAHFRTTPEDSERIRMRMQQQMVHRRKHQPLEQPSCGSVFRNPQGDHAGRLIDAVGLKGTREGDAEISQLHANFIINHGQARAADVLRLIERAQQAVSHRFGVQLEREVRILGGQG